MGSAPSAAANNNNTAAGGDKKDADAGRNSGSKRSATNNRTSHSSSNSNSQQTPPHTTHKHSTAAVSSVATAAAAPASSVPSFVKRSSSFSANSSSSSNGLVLPPIAGAATPSSLSRQIIQQPQPPLVPPGHVHSPVSRNRGIQRVPSASLLGRHSPASQQGQHYPTSMLGHVTPSPRGTIHINSGAAGSSAEKHSPPQPQPQAHKLSFSALQQPGQRTSPSTSAHGPNSASSATGRRSSRGDPPQPNSASSHSHSTTTLVQPFQPISPPQKHDRRLSASQQQHSYSRSPTPLQPLQQPQPPPQPVPPAFAAHPGTTSARGRKTLAVHTQLDPPHPALTTFAPTHPLPLAQPVVSHPSQQPVWFDTSAADEYLAAYGPSSPLSSRSPVLDMRDLEGVASWELPLPHNIVSDNHLMLQPFGVQQTHAMQVEEDMEYIMDRPIPAVDLEHQPPPKQLPPVSKAGEPAPATARRLRKHLSTGGGMVTTHMQAPPPIQTSAFPAATAASVSGATPHQPHHQLHLQQHHIPTSGGGSATHSAGSQCSFPRQTSSSAAEGGVVDRALSHQALSSLSASPASADAPHPFSAYGSAPPTLRPNSLQLTSPPSASTDCGGASSSSLASVGSPSTAAASGGGGGGLSSSFVSSSSGGSVTSRSAAAAAATLALVHSMPIDVALPIVQAAMYDESSEEYQEYKQKWIQEKEAAAKEAARTAAVDRAVAHGLLPPSHGRKSSRSMFGDSAGSPASGGSRALSPALVYSPIQPSSPLLMHRGHHIPSHSGYASPLRSLSPMGTPHSPTIFATLLESNSRNASRNMSPQPSSPMSRDRQMSPHGAGPGGGGFGGFGGAATKGAGTHRHLASGGSHHPPLMLSHDGLPTSQCHSGENTARSISGGGGGGGGGGQPPRHTHTESSSLCNTYDNLRLGWIPSDLAVSGAIPVPYK